MLPCVADKKMMATSWALRAQVLFAGVRAPTGQPRGSPPSLGHGAGDPGGADSPTPRLVPATRRPHPRGERRSCRLASGNWAAPTAEMQPIQTATAVVGARASRASRRFAVRGQRACESNICGGDRRTPLRCWPGSREVRSGDALAELGHVGWVPPQSPPSPSAGERSVAAEACSVLCSVPSAGARSQMQEETAGVPRFVVDDLSAARRGMRRRTPRRTVMVGAGSAQWGGGCAPR